MLLFEKILEECSEEQKHSEKCSDLVGNIVYIQRGTPILQRGVPEWWGIIFDFACPHTAKNPCKSVT